MTEFQIDAAARALWATRTSESWDQRLSEFPGSVDIARARADARAILSASGLLTASPTPPAQDEQLIGIVRAVLAEHWLFDIGCDHDAETNAPVCACCQVNLGTHSTVAGARDAWIAHVMEQIEETSRG